MKRHTSVNEKTYKLFKIFSECHVSHWRDTDMAPASFCHSGPRGCFCGPLLILSLAQKGWGPRGERGELGNLFTYRTLLILSGRFEALGTSQTVGGIGYITRSALGGPNALERGTKL